MISKQKVRTRVEKGDKTFRDTEFSFFKDEDGEIQKLPAAYIHGLDKKVKKQSGFPANPSNALKLPVVNLSGMIE